MRSLASKIWALAAGAWIAILLAAAPASAFQATPAADAASATSTEAQRSRLNARLMERVQEGQSILPVAAAVSEAATSAAPRSASYGTRYRAPSLDLRTPPRIPSSDIECLAQAIYYEARNESEEGQAAVAEVVMNRSRALGYPPRVCEVVYQRNSRTCQFTFTCDGSIGRSPIHPVAWARAETIARDVYQGSRPSILPTSSLNYHANYVRPSWASRLERVRQIGAHIFYGDSLTGGPRPGASSSDEQQRRGGLVFTRNAALDEAYARAMQPGS